MQLSRHTIARFIVPNPRLKFSRVLYQRFYSSSPSSSPPSPSPPSPSITSNIANRGEQKMAPTSPPPTPPPEFPTSLAEWRFRPIQRAECVELYRPGGYHPVHIGDLFHNRRYKVLSKLGYGAYSTVWLARDLEASEFVALKIKTARDSAEDRELTLLNYLKNSVASRLGQEHIISLKDSFYHEGPNGNHLCLVFELLGENIYGVLEDYSYETTGSDSLRKFPKPVAKRILKDILLGLNFLHRNGVVHGDLQPGNFLSTIKGLDALRSEDLEVKIEDVAVELKRIDGKVDKWAPTYIAMSRLLIQTDEWPVFPIKISDFGAGFLLSEPRAAKTIVTPIALRSPELMLDSHPLDTYIDIWAFGCLMFEMLVGKQLFMTIPTANTDNDSDVMLLLMHSILGPLPESIHTKWPRSGKYFRSDSREHYNSMVDGPEGILDPSPNIEAGIRDAVSHADGLDEEEADIVISLLRKILDYDPLKRPSASEILENSFWEQAAVAA
ncbi:hypothetical protein TWF718_005914 [Orbilia javanica]|uniref:non-specific serine/threonine protein kinase n=1 Tax=Orbilia javanica TaxID=47235 RepID=A0AAN8RJF3_9PEZI